VEKKIIHVDLFQADLILTFTSHIDHNDANKIGNFNDGKYVAIKEIVDHPLQCSTNTKNHHHTITNSSGKK